MKTLLIVLGGGGHTTQMLKLVDLLGKDFNYKYIIGKQDRLSEKRIRVKGKVFMVRKTRDIGEGLLTSFLKQVICCFEVLPLLIYSKAEAIISCGPNFSIPLCFVGKLLSKEIIFIESISRVYNKSNCGRILYYLSDLFFVQWEELLKKYPKSIYAGRLL